MFDPENPCLQFYFRLIMFLLFICGYFLNLLCDLADPRVFYLVKIEINTNNNEIELFPLCNGYQEADLVDFPQTLNGYGSDIVLFLGPSRLF